VVEPLVFVIGVAIVVYVLQGAVRTVVLPRASRTSLSNAVFGSVAVSLRAIASRRRRYEGQDAVLAAIAPVGLLLVPAVWLAIVLVGFACMFWATDASVGVRGAFDLAGSSMTTLGIAKPNGSGQQAISFVGSFIGLLLLTLVITYLPTIYSGFQRREQKVALLEVRAGAPPSAEVMLTRFNRIGSIYSLSEEWQSWEPWFAELEETHTTHASLPWFRSNVHTRSWVTSAGTVLDAAAIWTASVDGLSTPDHASAALTIRSGFLSLRSIASAFDIPFDPDPSPDDPITIQRSEFDAVLDVIEADGVVLVRDRDQAWRDFAGWRVNYDSALLGLAQMLRVPYAPWTSDRYPLEMRRRGRRARRP
jgi:hypothetical protein